MEKQSYDSEGNARHYDTERINTINIFEAIFGTVAVMHFCEINALKYRLRAGKKEGNSLEQEILKAKWYEKASRHYLAKIEQGDDIIAGLTRGSTNRYNKPDFDQYLNDK